MDQNINNLHQTNNSILVQISKFLSRASHKYLPFYHFQVDDEIQRPAPSRWQTAIARASNFQSFKGKSQNNDKRATLRKSGNAISSPIKSSVALRMSVIHVSTFIVCWTPFLVIQLWHIVDKKSAQGISEV